MELDEYLYGVFVKHFRSKKKETLEIASRKVELDPLKSRLTLLARAITGEAISIFPAKKEGGYKNASYFLPSSMALFASSDLNTSFYFYRILYLSIQQKLNLNWQKGEFVSGENKAFETSEIVLKHLFSEFPICESLHSLFKEQLISYSDAKHPPDFSWLYGRWMTNEPIISEDKTLTNFSEKVKAAEKNLAKTVLKAKPVEEVISIEIDKKQQEDYVMTHNFEKVETAEEFDGVWRDFDGDDELEKHKDAVNELNMKFTVRTDDTTHSVYQSDFIENANVSESSEGETQEHYISYDEWDYTKGKYKNDFCKVYPRALNELNTGFYHQTLKANTTVLIGLRKMLTSINNKYQQQRRQSQGNEFDIDSVTDLYVAVHSGHTPSENIYISNRKKEKEISILLLLDISLSSDGYVNGERIIDIEKRVAILFGEILNEFNIDFSIQGFYSKTRNYSSYLNLKSFHEKWDSSKFRIGAIEPSGFTRIGAALRHSSSLLQERESKNKWLILLSDGKPNDYDKYEGKYGVRDVKQAIHELKQHQINSFAIAIEGTAKYYLPQMFGQNHYQIVSSPNELVTSLVKLYEKIKYQGT